MNDINCRIPAIAPAERAERIDDILDRAMPQRKSTAASLRAFLIGPGLDVAFYRARLTILISLLIYLFMVMLSEALIGLVPYRECLVIMLFPLMHLSYFAISLWNEEQGTMVELKMTLKYSFMSIVSIRMFYISMMAILVNSVTVSQMDGIDYAGKVGAIGYSSVFIFSIIMLVIYEKYSASINIVKVAAVWIVLCILLAKWGTKFDYLVFQMVPLSVYIAAAAIFFVIMVGYIRKVENRYACA